jgi:hypothetical protein
MQGGLAPAGLVATSRIFPSVIHIGDTVTVQVTASPGEGVETPRPSPKIGAFDLLGVARGDSAGAAQVRIYVTAFETGNKVLPSIAIPVRSGGRIDSLRTPAYRISVESLLPADTTQIDSLTIHEARAPIEIPQKFLWGVFLGYVLVLSALTGLGWILYQKLRRKPATLPAFQTKAPPRPAEAVALEALDAIAAKGYVARGLYKQHYTEVMDVLRNYIEGRYGVEALDRTSWELAQALLSAPLDPEHRSRLHRLLEEADLVKFAKYIPEPEPAQHVLDEAKRWVRETTPTAPPATTGVP